MTEPEPAAFPAPPTSGENAAPSVDRAAFRGAMSRLAAAVSVVTSDGPAGRVGFTASAVCSVTDAPPTILVCMNAASAQNAALVTNGVMCVNTLCGHQAALSARFAGQTGVTGAARFDAHPHSVAATGAPVLADALVSLDCRIERIVRIGTHDVIFGRVEAIVHGPGEVESLVYFGRGYHRLPATPGESTGQSGG
ncbi:FMN reductase [Acuticoccus sediminis]|uniref:FMN reductase n=1 Tax=Acuticoccus sediminis TaxID=2184697 RepID=A0A8B2NVK8_9HYPH|nr:flavin reductase [Acuticoccus sediminis]RAI01783.1 FMN reductase [Acuticoccus sediminis]